MRKLRVQAELMEEGEQDTMTMTDPIADMLTRIRNANTAGHKTVDIPASKMKKSIAGILKGRGLYRRFQSDR